MLVSLEWDDSIDWLNRWPVRTVASIDRQWHGTVARRRSYRGDQRCRRRRRSLDTGWERKSTKKTTTNERRGNRSRMMSWKATHNTHKHMKTPNKSNTETDWTKQLTAIGREGMCGSNLCQNIRSTSNGTQFGCRRRCLNYATGEQ